MCLHSVSFALEKDGSAIGYKLFEVEKRKLVNYYMMTPVSRTSWNHDEKEFKINKKYRCGYHIFTNLNDAKIKFECATDSGKLFKVRYKNVVAMGKDCGLEVVVAKSFKILGEVHLC